jgi:hypothetical protein
MGDFDPVFIQTLKQQSWALYAVGMFLILLRMFEIPQNITLILADARVRYARIHKLGFKGLQTDDFLMILAGVSYSVQCVL